LNSLRNRNEFEGRVDTYVGAAEKGFRPITPSFRLAPAAGDGGNLFVTPISTLQGNAGTNWVATIAGRIGYAANNWLFYAKGGGGWADITASITRADSGHMET